MRPSTKCSSEKYQLAEVVGVMVRHQQRLAKYRLAFARGNLREQIS